MVSCSPIFVRLLVLMILRLVFRSLRAYRVLAFKHVLAKQALGTAPLRATDNALLLTAAAPWFLNGLHSVPDNGPSSRDLMGKILPHVNRVNADVQTLAFPSSTRAQVELPGEEEDEEDAQEDNISVNSNDSDEEPPAPVHRPARRDNRPETLPYNPYGIVFLRPIRIGQGTLVPRFHDDGTPMITPQTFRYIFGVDRDDIDNETFRAQLVVPSNPRRVLNRIRLTATRLVEEEEPPRIFNLAERGYELPPVLRDEGSDVEDDEPEEVDEDEDIDTKLTRIWRQFLVDLSAKVANRRAASQSSYCILSEVDRGRVDDSTYQNLDLREYFSDCQYRTATLRDWDLAFDKFWPEKGSVLTGRPQNFPSMKYYLDWGKLLRATTDDATAQAMRNAIRPLFNALNWIPNVQSDRVWYTKPCRSTLFQRFPESHPNNPGPRILIRAGQHAII